MAKIPLSILNDDPEPEDLWFLPADEFDEPAAAPLPRAAHDQLFPLAEWRDAEAGLAGDLARLSFDFGRLEERLRRLGPGARHRLALQEVAGLGWWTGDRLSVDRLVLWLALQIGATGSDAQAMIRAGWAARRLTAGPPPLGPDRAGALVALLALPAGAAVPERVVDACEVLARLDSLHPVVQGAVLFHLWRLGAGGPAHDIEAAVLAARLAGSIAGQGAFLPQALAGFSGLAVQGSAGRRLAGWIAGAHQSVLAALLHLDRLERWRARAAAATADLSGRTPPQLLQLLADWPSITAPMAEAEAGASRAAVQRNLDLLTARGVTRELTGQGRYRVWTADL